MLYVNEILSHSLDLVTHLKKKKKKLSCHFDLYMTPHIDL